ncbi:MAG: hypothetical protein GY742_07920 [Hyphomicrobiales bacterium]|nr:hypothetical protein [Hyphomicrobiales bacterium]
MAARGLLAASDGAENNWPSYESFGHFEVAGYYMLDQHLMVPEVLVMSKKQWNKLSADSQKAVLEAAATSKTGQRQLWADREKASEEKVRAAGNKIITDIDKAAFINAMVPVYKKYVTDDNLKALITRIQAMK